MKSLTEARLQTIFSAMKGKRILVVGDLMIDRYIWGTVTRISPEAPVPVIEVTEESERLGGAANVGNNIISLGGECTLVGVCGNDRSAGALRFLVKDMGMNDSGIMTDPTRPTTVKTRVIAQHQHVVRIDHEEKNDIDHEMVTTIMRYVKDHVDEIDGIILEDYNKGVLTKELIYQLTTFAKEYQLLITVDPKLNHFFEYQHVTVFKPNLKETSEGLGKSVKSDEEVFLAGNELLKRLNASHVLITRSEKGMSLFKKDGGVVNTPTYARHVADVSGAGDTVIATMTLCLAAGATIEEAVLLSNLAGGYVVGEVGIVPATPEHIIQFWKQVSQ